MLLNIVFIVVGIALVLWGADRLTDGAVAVAEKMKMPQIVIGLTIVAMGTSMPEFCVSLVSALKGTPDLAVGNIVGSNIFNALLIVGVAAMVSPMTILKTTVRKDIPFALVSSVVLMMMCFDGKIGRIDAAVLFVMFVAFMYMTLQGAKADRSVAQQEGELIAAEAGVGKKSMSALMSAVWILIGLACLIGGSNLFVEGATQVASQLGVSEAVIGLTIVAGGTSLPELATSVVSARKGNSGIAIGNVLGSNVFNVLGILGATGLVSPMVMQGITMTDLSILVISMILIWFFSFTKYTIERWEGALLTAVFLGYMWWLI
ncbi:MAG: calcium/sodium antiporter [Prevotella sp.]|nr:calcium/sodium antiporter [Prevotella sp.]